MFIRLRRLFSVLRPPAHLALGREGEREAERLLRRQGYRVLARNAVCPAGEADLVCEDPDGRTIVIVEVKTRRPGRGRSSLRPEASVHSRKRRKLLAIARYLARANGWEGRPLRIDVVAVEWPAGLRARASARHHVSAVTA
ncbi:MAG: YraN family protein [Phycisphaerales bacterium]|nr:YraN family protein [Phycisphaerales bacterium]